MNRRRIASAVILIAVIAGWTIWLRPPALGGDTSVVVVSGESMEPGMHQGDLAIARAQDQYGVDDVVVFTIPTGEPAEGGQVIHRIIGGNEDGYQTQGDNVPLPDPWVPTESDVVGTVVYHVPKAGTVLTYILSGPVLGLLCAALGAWMGWRKVDPV